MRKDQHFWYCLMIAAGGLFLSIRYYNYPVHDFGNYYFGSKLLLSGHDVREIYEPYKFNLLIRSLFSEDASGFFGNYAVVPPLTLLFYTPLSFMEAGVAKFLFNVFSVAIFCFGFYRFLKYVLFRTGAPVLFQLQWIFLPLVLFIPFRNNILFGQTYLLITGMLLLGFVEAQNNRSIRGAVLFAVPIALKLFPAITLFYLLAKRNKKILGFTCLFSAALFFAPVLVTGSDFFRTYITDFIPRMMQNEINDPYATNYQSAGVLLRNLFIPDPILNPGGPFNSASAYGILTGVFTGFLIYLLLRSVKRQADHLRLFSIVLTTGLLITSYTSNYSLMLLLPVCVDALRMPGRFQILVFMLVLIAAAIPSSVLASLPLIFQFPRLYALFILLALLVRPINWEPREFIRLAGCLGFFILISVQLKKTQDDKTVYFLRQDVPLLSYDFAFAGNKLILSFMDERGPQQISVDAGISISSIRNLSPDGNRSRFLEKLTANRHALLKPVLINNDQIVFLSDFKRGIGFYALRTMKLSPDEVKTILK